MKTSIRVRGVTYRDPDQAYVAAEELEHHADTLAENLRRSGKEGEADQVQDRGHADAERLRAWAREREQTEAERTEQPADRPTTPPRSGNRGTGTRRRATTTRRHRRTPSRGGGGFTPRTRSIVTQTRIPAATSSASSLLLQAIGMSLGVAFLTILLSSRGVTAFGSLAGSLGNGLAWIIEPVDPLAPRPKPQPAAARGASLSAAVYARSGAATRRPVASGVIG